MKLKWGFLPTGFSFWRCLSFFALAPLAALQADFRENAGLWIEAVPSAPFKAPNPNASQFSGEGYFGQRFFLDADGAQLLVAGLRFRHTVVPVANPTGFGSIPAVTFLSAAATYAQSLSDAHTIVASFRPGVFADLTSFSGGAFRPEGFLLWDYQARPELTLGLGVARGSNFGRVLVVPVVHLLWTSENWLLDVFAPAKAELWYLPNPHWEFGLTAALSGSQYSSVDAVRGFDTLRLAGLFIGPAARYRVFEKGFVSLEAGVDSLRRLEFVSNETVVADLAPGTQVFVRAGLQWRY